MVIAFASILSGYEASDAIEEFGHLKYEWLKTFLELPHGIPEEKTFRDVFKVLDARQVHKALDKWLEDIKETKGIGPRAVNIDGKTIRGSRKEGPRSALHVVSAWVDEENLSLGEVAVMKSRRYRHYWTSKEMW